MHPTTDLAIVAPATAAPGRRARARDAVVGLYSAEYPGLVRLARLVAHDPAIAEDIVQEAFVRLYGTWGRVQDPTRAPAYLRTTVVNLARGRARHHQVTLRRRPPASPDAASAEEGVLRREARDAVLDALRRLPARQRECLVLRHYLDQTESEIAATLGISVGSVRTHVRRGMETLERRLGGMR